MHLFIKHSRTVIVLYSRIDRFLVTPETRHQWHVRFGEPFICSAIWMSKAHRLNNPKLTDSERLDIGVRGIVGSDSHSSN